jgi:mono/diheme cytochrome c family protein
MSSRPGLPFAALMATLLALSGCGSREAGETPRGSSTATPAATSSLDAGPRAIESDRDDDAAKVGEQLFKDKGCSACHAFGQRVAGPDLAGVSRRRTAKWIESQILHPDKMVKEDPIARQLFAQFALQMPNQGLTPDEAKQIIEYFKHQDHEAEERQ